SRSADSERHGHHMAERDRSPAVELAPRIHVLEGVPRDGDHTSTDLVVVEGGVMAIDASRARGGGQPDTHSPSTALARESQGDGTCPPPVLCCGKRSAEHWHGPVVVVAPVQHPLRPGALEDTHARDAANCGPPLGATFEAIDPAPGRDDTVVLYAAEHPDPSLAQVDERC